MSPSLEDRIAGIENYLDIKIYGYDLNGKPKYCSRIPPSCGGGYL